ncbi:MAG: hypothetical protein GX589_06600 [Deltaproteobacteria bacterium]|nr:hypothetical protein [Deltaproteobacteria bacterium]
MGKHINDALRNTRYYCELILALAVVALAMAHRHAWPVASMTSALQRENWHSVIHFSENSYFSWRLNTLVFEAAQALCGEGCLDAGVAIIQLAILFFGYSWLLVVAAGGSVLSAALTSALFCYGVSFLWGADLLITGSLAWMPWLMALLLKVKTKDCRIITRMFLIFCVAYMLAGSANQLAILLAPAALIGIGEWHPLKQEQDAPARGRMAALFILILLPAALTLWQAPRPDFPPYPGLSHVVPHTGVPGMVRPLIGPAAPSVAIIDRNFVRHNYAFISLWALILSFALAYIIGLKRSKHRSAVTALTLFVLVALDTLPSESTSQIMPLAVLARTIPHLFYFSLTGLTLAVGFLFLILWLHQVRSSSEYKKQKIAYLGLLVVVALFLLTPHALGRKFAAGALQDPESLKVWHEFLDKFPDRHSDQAKRIEKSVISPSYAMLRNEGLWPVLAYEELKDTSFKPVSEAHTLYVDSSGNKARKLLNLTGKHARRWSLKKGRQEGDEWLAVYFKKPQPLRGVELYLGDFKHDFPRGVRLSFKAECHPEEDLKPEAFKGYTLALEIPKWQGAPGFTPQGHPYYSAQSNVKLFLRKPLRAQCLHIQQIAKEPNFDWSLVELRLWHK